MFRIETQMAATDILIWRIERTFSNEYTEEYIRITITVNRVTLMEMENISPQIVQQETLSMKVSSLVLMIKR